MKWISVLWITTCFCVQGFTMTVDALKNLDSAKIAAMNLPDLLDAKIGIDDQFNWEKIS
jgi:hypothetical protein